MNWHGIFLKEATQLLAEALRMQLSEQTEAHTAEKECLRQSRSPFRFEYEGGSSISV